MPRRSRTRGRRSRAGCPSVWPSPTQTSTPCSPGGLRMPSGSGSAAQMNMRAGRLARLDQLAQLLDRAEEVRLLYEHGGGVVVDGGRECLEIGGAGAVERQLHDLHAVARGVGGERGARVRMQAARREQLGAPRLELGEVAGRRHGARALVHGGVRDGQPGELRDGGLVLEHHLQPALRDLGLIRRVRREELGAAEQRVDQRRYVVVVHAGAEEADLGVRVHVAGGERRQVLVDLLLGAPVRQVDGASQAHALRYVGEQIVERADADRAEHLLQVLLGDCGVAAHLPTESSYPLFEHLLVGGDVHQAVGLGRVRTSAP